jgi:hypothetical protein
VPAPADAPPSSVVDPHAIAPCAAKLSADSLRAARPSLGILSMSLRLGEQVEALVQGRINGSAAVAVLTDLRVLLVNEREWSPEVVSFEVIADLAVQGLQDDRTASLTFIGGGENTTISSITDRPLAHDLARLVRGRVADLSS